MVMRVHGLVKDSTLDYRRIIEAEGAEFLGIENGWVFFYDEQSGQRLSVSARACTPTNIRSALKNAREQVAPQQPVAADIDPVTASIYEHLSTIFGPEDIDFVAKELGLRNFR